MTCPDCSHRIAVLERELAMSQTDLGNSEVELRRVRREKTKLKTDLRRALGEDDMTEQVNLVIAHYNTRFGRQIRFRPFSRNDELIRKALRCADTLEDSAALCFQAIDGLAVKPFVVERQGKPERAPEGPERQRYSELKHCLKDDEAIRRFAGYAREAREGGDRIPDRQPVVGRSLYEQAVAEAVEWAQKAQARGTALELCREFIEVLEAENERLRGGMRVAA